jgi:hypothetical protein
MRPKTLIQFVVLAAVGLLACGGGGGAGVVDGGIGDGPGGGAGNNACAIPCLASLRKDCVPGGACTHDFTAGAGRVCYANGFQQAVSFSISGMTSTSTSTFSLNGEACWSIETMSDLSGSSSSVIKDSQGKAIATSRFGPGGYVISCNGKDYDLVGAGCFAGFAGAMPGPGSDCQAGTCP